MMASVQRHLLAFNWRSMGLLDYAVLALRLDGPPGAAAGGSAVEVERQDRAAALLAELRSFSVSLQAKPQQLLLESGKLNANQKRRVLLFDDMHGAVGAEVR